MRKLPAQDTTLPLPRVPKRPGRPRSGKAKTRKQLSKERRDRLRKMGLKEVSVVIPAARADEIKRYARTLREDCADASSGDAGV